METRRLFKNNPFLTSMSLLSLASLSTPLCIYGLCILTPLCIYMGFCQLLPCSSEKRSCTCSFMQWMVNKKSHFILAPCWCTYLCWPASLQEYAYSQWSFGCLIVFFVFSWTDHIFKKILAWYLSSLLAWLIY